MLPEVKAKVRKLKPPKPVYYCCGPNVNFDDPAVPFGTTPMICEGGGRFDKDLVTPGWQEDNYWVGGYYGPKDFVIEEKVAAALSNVPSGTHYCFNVEHWKTDPREPNVKDTDVEDAIRKFRTFFATAQKYRPDLRYSVYRIAPQREYWTPNNYQMGVIQWERYKKEGISKFTDRERRELSQVASNKADHNIYEWDDTKDAVVAFKKWKAANDRLGHGVSNKGSVLTTEGLVDIVDYLAPSLYDFYTGNDESYIKLNIEEARRIAGGRPIYPFVWPVYHPGGGITGDKDIPLAEWRAQLRQILSLSDGIIIWGATMPRHREHILIALDEAERAVSKRK